MYILLARAHNTETLTDGVAFAALTLFQLQEQPLISIISTFEQFQTLINSFERIQEYLVSDERVDARITSDRGETRLTPSSSSGSDEEKKSIMLKDASLEAQARLNATGHAAILESVGASYSSEKGPVLKDISASIATGKITMVCGPVGSGKSTFLKVLLGEMPQTTGTVATAFSSAAYCPQSPWVTWGTIRENILGMCSWDQLYYNTVVRACALSTDIETLPAGDQTMTGTRGSRLSGGQQIRVVSPC